MFVYNFKINGTKWFRNFFIGVILLVVCILGIVMYKVFHGANEASIENACMPKNQISTISANNYTNVLKVVHDNIDDYIGVKIKFTGYVYRVSDLNENQFVLSRDMVISSDHQYVVVGFLCETDKAKEYSDGTWIEATGEITKGDYHGDMPVIKVTDVKQVDKPNEDIVYPPDDTYIPTSGIL